MEKSPFLPISSEVCGGITLSDFVCSFLSDLSSISRWKIWRLVLSFCICAGTQLAWATAVATSTTLSLTSAGVPITSLVGGNAVSLTATVTANGTIVFPGQVDFCDATASYCTDIHLLGTAQLTKGGAATLKLIPGNGTHSYKAVFRGTSIYATSSSGTLSLAVSGPTSSVTTIAQSGTVGNYTLTTTVAGNADTPPTGTISFLRAANGSAPVATASLTPNAPQLTVVQSFNISLENIPYPYDIASFSVGDFNGDGIPDIVEVYGFLLNLNHAGAIVLLGDGSGNFTVASTLDLGPHLSAFVTPRVADFNGDGIPDLVIGDGISGQLTILLGNGDGTFSLKGSTSAQGSFTSFTVGDFNQDGIEDIAVANTDYNLVVLLIGNGDGTFSPSSAAATASGGSPSFITSADFNGDGIPDLAIANQTTPPSVSILLGNGDGSFTSSGSIQMQYPPKSISVADFNEDGKTDLAIGSDTTLSVLLGGGDGTFSPTPESPITIANNNYPSSEPVQVGDFNGDGKADLVVSRAISGVTVLLGNGDGTFSGGFTAQGNAVINPAIADFNGDGRSDLVNGEVLLSVDQSASATATGVAMPVSLGTQQVHAHFSGDSNYKTSDSSTTSLGAAQGPSTISVSASENSVPLGFPVTLAATVTGPGLTPTGSVTLLDGSATLTTATLNSNGSATYVTSALNMGVHSIVASYSGDGNYFSSLSPALSLTITKPAPAVTLTSNAPFSPLGTSVTFTATITGGNTVATGTVTFQDATTQLAQVALNSGGVAVYSTTSLSQGTHTITAAYGGDSNYSAVTSSAVVVVSSSKPFLSVAGTAVAVTAGATGGNTSTITVTPAQGFVGIVSLMAAVTSGPSGGLYPPTVSFGSTSPVNITGPSAATAILSVSTTGAQKAVLMHPKGLGAGYEGAVAALACVLLFAIPARRRGFQRLVGLVGLFVALLFGVLSCGSGGGNGNAGTTPGAYVVTVTAGSGPISQQATVSLTVQ